MSLKLVAVVAVVGATGWALSRNPVPVPPNATAADSAAVSQAGIGARFQYGLGMLGSKVVSSSVRSTVHETETSLQDMKAGIKNTKGGDGDRARKYAAKVVQKDSTALFDLQYGRPVKAVKAAMEAKSLLGAVRGQVARP
jgi:hypothetical protein